MCSGYALARIRRAFFRYAMAAEWRPYAPRRGYVLGLWPLRAYAAQTKNDELNDVLASVFQLVKDPLLFR